MPDGRVAVCGWTNQPVNWPAAPGWSSEVKGGRDAFVAILGADLETVEAYTTIGGGAEDVATALTVDPFGNIVVVGWTLSADFPATSSTVAPIFSAYTDGFVASFTKDLMELRFATYINGSGEDIPTDVTLDDNQSIFICGFTTSATRFPIANGLFKQITGRQDGFVMRLTPLAASVQFSTYFGGSLDDAFRSITLDNGGNIYLAGYTSSADYPMFPKVDPWWWWGSGGRPYDNTYNGGLTDATLTVLSQDGARAISTTYFGGSGSDYGNGVAFLNGNAVLVGSTTSANFPTYSPLQATLLGPSDAFISVFKDQGRLLGVSTYFGGSGSDSATCINNYNQTTFAIAGITTSNDFPGNGHLTRTGNAGNRDGFVMLTNTTSVSFSTTFGGGGSDLLTNQTIQLDGGIVIAGSTTSTLLELSSYDIVASVEGTMPRSCAVRIQRGGINLNTPAGGERICEGALPRVNWTSAEMLENEVLALEASTDMVNWILLADSISGGRHDWKVSSTRLPLGEGYYIRIRSGRGHTSTSPTPVRFDPAPNVIQFPAPSVLLCQGQNTVLRATVSGSDLLYQWLRNGTEIPGATADSLTISESSGNADGTYRLRYLAPCGISEFTPGSVVTIATNTRIDSQPESVTAIAGQTVQFSVRANGHNLSYRWRKDGIALPLQRTATLSIAAVQPSDAGIYTCTVTGTCGEVASTQAVLTVDQGTRVSELRNGRMICYPNPANDVLTIESALLETSLSQVRFVNAVGQVALIAEVSTATDIQRVDVRGLAVGPYAVIGIGGKASSGQFPLGIVAISR
jgi:hypothetical protein